MKKNIKRWILALFAAALTVWVLWANTALEATEITVSDAGLPEAFDGFRIAHVSDLHSAEMGQGNEKLIGMLRAMEPDIIAITGDLMDSRDTSAEVVLSFAEQAMQIAPCYYVTGNHEVRLANDLYETLMEGLEGLGVVVLEDEQVVLTRDESSICIAGHAWGSVAALEKLSGGEQYTVLLSHPPEDIDAYAAAGFQLVLSGHAHGGQFRLPFIGGLVAPGQGFFPKYDAGLYRVDDTFMVVSRGIGNSIIPLRFNNRPEVILVTLTVGD